MKTCRLPCILIFLFGISSVNAQSLYPIVVNGYHGYIDSVGKVIISAQFKSAFGFHGNICIAKYSASGKYVLIDKTGKPGGTEQYEFINSLSDGVYLAEEGEDEWGFLDSTGKVLIPFLYDYAQSMSDGLAPVRRGYEWGYINKAGEMRIPFQFYKAGIMMDGIAVIESKKRVKGIVTSNGTVTWYEDAREIRNLDGGNYAVHNDLFWEIRNRIGENICKTGFEDILKHIDGLFIVKENARPGEPVGQGRTGVLSEKGRFVIKPECDYIYVNEDFPQDSLFAVSVNGKYGIMSFEGKWILKPMYHLIFPFKNGYAPFKQDGKYGMLDKEGSVIIEAIYEDIHACSEGLVPVKQNSKWGVINLKGEWIVPATYSDIQMYYKGLISVSIDGLSDYTNYPRPAKMGYLNMKGEVVWEPSR